MWEYNYSNPDVLCHYGVKGMKWGHRKSYSESYNSVRNAKAAYKTAHKTYKKDFNKAYNRAAAVLSPIKKHRVANDARWEKASNSADASRKAKQAYKDAKRANREAISKVQRKLFDQSSVGEKFMFNEATRRKAAKYVVNNNMTVDEAYKKAKGAALRNTAIFLGAYGIAVATKTIRV